MISSLSASVVLSSARTKSSALKMCKVNLMEYIYNEPTQENYTGVETTPFWNYFFCRFLLRLSENNHSRVMFIAKFGSTASDFGYKILIIFGVEIGAFVRPHV